MTIESRFLRETENNGLMFWCPGCDCAHRIQHGAGTGPRWTWNGNVNKPSFFPSVLVTYDHWVPAADTLELRAKINKGEVIQTQVHDICHSFVTDGRIQFLGDCTHSLAGQTVELPLFES
jgi:hypothetical protein